MIIKHIETFIANNCQRSNKDMPTFIFYDNSSKLRHDGHTKNTPQTVCLSQNMTAWDLPFIHAGRTSSG